MLRAAHALILLTLVAPSTAARELAWIEDAAGRLTVRLDVPAAGAMVEVDLAAALSAHVGRCMESQALPPMLAEVEVRADGVWLRPRFPLDPTGDYCAVFDSSRLPRPSERSGLRLTAEWTGTGAVEAPRVERVLPAVDTLPANALRLYVEFSRPVFARDVHRWVRLRDETLDTWVETPFVDLPQGLWDPRRQRLTLVFHPGRIKRGVGPNRAMGPPLEPGHSYRLTVAAPGTEDFAHRFSVAVADRRPVEPADWRLTPPASAGSALRVDFGEALDPYLVERWIWIESAAEELVEVEATVDPDGAAITLTPVDRWPRGGLDLLVDPRLEDLAGNRVAQLFERPRPDLGSEQRRPPSLIPVRLRVAD